MRAPEDGGRRWCARRVVRGLPPRPQHAPRWRDRGPTRVGHVDLQSSGAKGAVCTGPGSPRTLAHTRSLLPPGHRLTTASVDAQATKSDEAWTPEEEEELVKLVAHEEYRKVRLGDTTTKWAPIAAHFSRTVKAVKRKFDKLQNPSKGAQGGGKG